MDPLLLLFIKPIDFHNTLQFNTLYKYLSIQSSHPNQTQNNTSKGQHNRTQHKHNKTTKHTYSTQQNKEYMPTCKENKTLQKTRKKSIQYNRRQDNTTQHNAARYGTMRCEAILNFNSGHCYSKWFGYQMSRNNFETIFVSSKQICF